ncbi:glucose-6-phosphate 1-dehydrogenase [Staphylococcus piscifermentans]|uniref:Glucose-6-phosphate 1-dehydrogenase n=2 Tax=Staphylococcus piscifermentans TaxID=70258 RepID=A0A239TVR1_9STAP|nr:glucose-6-phosphate 1-dehydrogenase [Staphylococcus piscifermentans]SNV01612.1 glucose-6-phosphate 1-dehydrogenase [Staphylococcus piscifermentans]
MKKNISALITIFGATGDLSYRKLFPSIYNLFQKGYFAESVAIIGAGIDQLTTEEFRKQVKAAIQNHIDNPEKVESFLKHLFYKQQDVNDTASYESLLQLSQKLEDQFNLEGNRLFYLAMSPNFFGIVAKNLKDSGLTNTKGFKRIIIEKPFGDNLKSAEKLNNQIRNSFEEDEIFRIDHYLGKEMIQNIERLRFGNTIFEPLWNNKYISNIQITSAETLGVEDRGGYYESSGALKDMVQNHLLQMVSLLAMETPNSRNSNDIRREKVQVLKALKNVKPIEIKRNFVRGQYDKGIINNEPVQAYRSEPNVDPNSTTETFVAGKIEIDNVRWAGVPFYVRTGKRMSKKSIQIVIEFKKNPRNLYYENNEDNAANLLVIDVQPNEGFSLCVNGKKSDQNNEMQSVKLPYTMPINDKMNTVDAYENLIFDVLLGDQTNFTHWDELMYSWLFIDEIEKVWSYEQPNFPNYKAGTNGPEESDELLERDGLSWWNNL